jgi:hypothetical protein
MTLAHVSHCHVLVECSFDMYGLCTGGTDCMMVTMTFARVSQAVLGNYRYGLHKKLGRNGDMPANQMLFVRPDPRLAS